ASPWVSYRLMDARSTHESNMTVTAGDDYCNSAAFQALSEQNSTNRKKLEAPACVGRNSMAVIRFRDPKLLESRTDIGLSSCWLDALLMRLVHGVLIFCLISLVSGNDIGFSQCNCEDDGGFWSIERIMVSQRVSDFLIAIAYFSIPIELLYFISCSNVPFKWVLVQFILFIVLCGMTHNGWTYGSSNPFQLMLALTIFKFLTALVSCATAITLVTLIPLLLKVKVRELFLKKKAWELDREVGMMKKQKEASWHVRMLTQGIRKSLDRHTILYTTLIELSNTLDLQNCAVWMPNESRTEMKLTHELKGRNSSNSHRDGIFIPINDLDVSEVKKILPSGTTRVWSYDELEIVKVVADQVAVAVSHAAILEESQLMREKLVEKNRQLQHARKEAMMASQARNSFQKVMSKGMRRPMHSI
ncbi:hypothetical protein GIB67_007032, partial [Kingdonia uniflora]